MKYLITIELLIFFSASEEASAIATFSILPFLFSPASSKRKKGKNSSWKPSKIEMKDVFITHLKSYSELQETVTRRKNKYAQLGCTLQPFIIIVGPSINEIAQFYVYVDNTYYVLNSIVGAIDCCFKVIHALNLEYPIECLQVWTFIQKVFLRLKLFGTLSLYQ